MTTDAYQLGAVTAILEDLIADLMGGDGDNHEITPGQAGGCVAVSYTPPPLPTTRIVETPVVPVSFKKQHTSS